MKTPCVRLSIDVFLSTLSLRRATNIPKAHGSAFAFLSTLSLRRATRRSTGTVQRFRYFYPRSPCGERLDDGARGFKIDLISIHALLAESDQFPLFIPVGIYISIHALLAESDFRLMLCPLHHQYFYPRSPCGERPKASQIAYRLYNISIHALLAESDASFCRCSFWQAYFYPRSPCGERRPTGLVRPGPRYFYPRSPCGERPGSLAEVAKYATISIHALLAESDICQERQAGFFEHFYPRSPCGERPGKHAQPPRRQDFYPRSPCGERQCLPGFCLMTAEFLSTLSLRRATAKVHKTVGHFCAYETNFMKIASSC